MLKPQPSISKHRRGIFASTHYRKAARDAETKYRLWVKCRKRGQPFPPLKSSDRSKMEISYQEPLMALEADVQHANALLAGISDPRNGKTFQMKVVCSELAPLFFFLAGWVDFTCNCLIPLYLDLFHILIYEVYPDGRLKVSAQGRRKATIREFYTVILPSILHIHDNLAEKESNKYSKKKHGGFSCRMGTKGGHERDEECGICLETGTKMVLPSCCHAMCINCYRDWSLRSESCPFCREGLKRVRSEDLWVLTGSSEVVDMETVLREEVFQLYRYIHSLPGDLPDALFWVYYEYLM